MEDTPLRLYFLEDTFSFGEVCAKEGMLYGK